MEYGKYIIVRSSGFEVAIVFSPLIEHSYFSCLSNNKIISAGFFRVEADFDKILIAFSIKVTVFGESISLHLKPRKEDALLIAKILNPTQGN